jgi:chromosome partitioning protein
MVKTIGLVQLKGGAGRSTISINLAGELARDHKVTIIDCDLPQGTVSSWYSIRDEIDRTGQLSLASAGNHTELIEQIKNHQGQDYIIIDTPPRIAEVTKAVLILSDLLIVPIASTAIDFWATHDLLEIIEKASSEHDVNYRILFNRCRAGTRSTMQLQRLAKEQGYPLLTYPVGLRTIYPDSISEGLIATESRDKKAAGEIIELTREVKQLCD